MSYARRAHRPRQERLRILRQGSVVADQCSACDLRCKPRDNLASQCSVVDDTCSAAYQRRLPVPKRPIR